MLTPHDIEQYPLGKAVVGGYKCEAVDSFLDNVAADYQKLYDENLALTKKITVLVERINEYRKDEEYLKNAMVEAQKIVDNTIRDAQETADRVMTEANKKAELVVGGSEKRARELDTHYEQMKVEINSFRNQLLNTYKSHIEIISALPIYERPDTASVVVPDFLDDEADMQEKQAEKVEISKETSASVLDEMKVQTSEDAAQDTSADAAEFHYTNLGESTDTKDMSDLAAAINGLNTDAQDDEDTFNTVDFE